MVTDPSKLKVKEILTGLSVVQLWAFIGAVIGVLAGSFYIGYQVSESLHEKITLDESTLQQEVKGLSDKNRFLSLFLRFELTKNEIEESDMQSEAWENYETTRKAFDEFVRERVTSEKLILHKGGSLATIRFSDGTIWNIPQELHIVALY